MMRDQLLALRQAAEAAIARKGGIPPSAAVLHTSPPRTTSPAPSESEPIISPPDHGFHDQLPLPAKPQTKTVHDVLREPLLALDQALTRGHEQIDRSVERV